MKKQIKKTNFRPGSYYAARTLSILTLALVLTLGSCTKKSHPADEGSTFPNTVTVTDVTGYHNAFFSTSQKPHYPVSFSSTGPVNFTGVDVIVTREGSSYRVQIAIGSESPVSLNLTTGPGSGTGLYTLLPADADHNLYFQNKPTNEAWKCTGGSVNVTTLQPNKVIGTFTLNLSGTAGAKTVTGTFDANEPQVNL